PELGPFAVVRISRTAVEADGEVLGTRLPTEPPSWSVGGTRRPDIAFRTTTTAYHPRVAEAPVAAAIAAAPTVVDDAPPTVAAPTPIPPSGVAEVDAEEPAPERAFRATTRRPSEVYSPPGSHGAILES